MNVLILDAHPDEGRLTSTLLDTYVAALPSGVEVTRIAVRDLSFDPVLRAGYAADQPWERDVANVGAALAACDHLVVAFPLWWGGEPAALKGLLDRLLLPGFAFKYHRHDSFWDRLLAGRSADVIVTMDTPPWYLRLVYGDPIGHRWRKQVLGFCGIKPLRIHRFGQTRRGGAAKSIDQWRAAVQRAATTAPGLKRGSKHPTGHDHTGFLAAVKDRQS